MKGCGDEPPEGWKDVLLALKSAGVLYQRKKVRGALRESFKTHVEEYVCLTNCFTLIRSQDPQSS
tara:strand:- start:68 stop:262 length:195 start_codon:yes stop_codon:yes gene_type:complete